MSEYNFIYKKLAQGPDDVVGALAYALYKEEKLAYVKDFEESRGSAPADADLQEFHRMTNMPQRIDAYKQQAERLLQEFLEDALVIVLQEREKQMHQEFVANKLESVEARIDLQAKSVHEALAQKNRFWSGVLQNVLAGLVTTLIAFGFVLATWMWAEGPTKIISGAWTKYNGQEQAPTEGASK